MTEPPDQMAQQLLEFRALLRNTPTQSRVVNVDDSSDSEGNDNLAGRLSRRPAGWAAPTIGGSSSLRNTWSNRFRFWVQDGTYSSLWVSVLHSARLRAFVVRAKGFLTNPGCSNTARCLS